MKYILTPLFCLLFGSSYSQYNGLTTIYKIGSVDILVDISNYNEHTIRQQLADSIFYNYTHYVDKKTPIVLTDYTVEGELRVEQFSPRTIVLFYECKKFISNSR
jgi:hypothetical protein